MSPPVENGLKIELKRKGIHLFALIIPVGLFLFPASFSLPLLFSVTVLFLLVDLLRLYFLPVRGLFLRFFSSLLRPHEAYRFTGSTALLLSASACTAGFLCLNRETVLLPLQRIALFYVFSFLILGDAAAAVFGKRFGRRKILGQKSVAGSVACFITCLLIAGMSVPLVHPTAGFFFPILFTALLTTFLEALPFRLDDNLLVPPVTCPVFYILIARGGLA